MTLRDKIINGEKLTSDEVKRIVHEYADLEYEIVDREHKGRGRWTEWMTTIIRLKDDKYYALSWDKGLTEYQEDNFDAQVAIPVAKKEIVSYIWVAI